MIDKRKTDTLGISVNNDLSPVEVYFEGELDPVVRSELEYLYGGGLKFISGGLSSENAFIKGTDEAKIINTESALYVDMKTAIPVAKWTSKRTMSKSQEKQFKKYIAPVSEVVVRTRDDKKHEFD